MSAPVHDEAEALHRTEILLAAVLRTGVLAAAALVGAGLVLHLAHGGTEPSLYAHFAGSPLRISDIPSVMHGVAHLRGRSVIELGLLVLIATPVVRVALSVGVFVRERDLTYVFVTLIVLGALVFSLLSSAPPKKGAKSAAHGATAAAAEGAPPHAARKTARNTGP